MKVGTGRLRKRLDKYAVPYKLVQGWDSPAIDPYKGRNDMHGVILHHTAGRDSLRYIVSGNPYAPVRACHFLVDRDGMVQVVSGSGAYHAGRGGPWKITKALTIPKDSGNSRLYGIEIESIGTKAAIDGSPQGMTVEQVVSTAMLCVALLDAMRPGPGLFKVGRVIRHRDWTPRKVDTQQDLGWWREVIALGVKYRKDPSTARAVIRGYVKTHPKGQHPEG
jgi:N-acetyl-anhydromuramyl-L-alanine amidase AmpD